MKKEERVYGESGSGRRASTRERALPASTGRQRTDGGTSIETEPKARAARGASKRWARSAGRRSGAQSRPTDSGSGPGRSLEQLLHLGIGRRNSGRGAIGNNARGFRGVLPKHGCGASGNGSRDTLGLGVRCRCELRTRSAGGQSAANGRTEAAQTEE